jgi:diguanylate cyclase (GGDEF)-like protein
MSATLLIADADLFFLRLYSEVLSRAGHRVLTCSSTTEFEDTLASLGECHIAFVELGLGGGLGVEWAEQLARLAAPPILVGIGTPADSRLMGRASRVGVSDFLPKPIEADYLVQHVQRLLDRRAQASEAGRLVSENLFQLEVQRIFKDGLLALRTLDEEALYERLLELATTHTRCQGMALYIHRSGGLERVGHRGLIDENALPAQLTREQALLSEARGVPRRGAMPIDQPLLLGGSRLPSIVAPEVARGLLLPIYQDSHLEGVLVATARVGHPFDGADMVRATLFVEIAAVALSNARRFGSERRQSARAPGAKTATMRFFVDFLGKELHKARRYRRQFALLDIKCDAFTAIAAQLGKERAAQLSTDITRKIEALLRDADMLARAGDDEFLVLLPETDLFGARATLTRIEDAIAGDPALAEIEKMQPLGLTLGCACFPADGNDVDSLIAALKRRLEEMRTSPLRRLHMHDASFYDCAEFLLSPHSPLRRSEGATDFAYTAMTPAESTAVAAELLLTRHALPLQRTTLYVGAAEITPALIEELAAALPPAWAGQSGRVYLFGGGRSRALPSAFSHIPLADEQAARLGFVMSLDEHCAYALIGETLGTSSGEAFHTADYPLALGLVRKLQSTHGLRRFL